MSRSEVRYARVDGLAIAYQVLGDGPIDVVYVAGTLNNLEAGWETPALVELFERIARYGRLIAFDRRGVGLSDRLPSGTIPSIEDRAADVLAVMDAAGSTRASLIGVADSGPAVIYLAVSHPERCEAIVLKDTCARAAWADDYPGGFHADDIERLVGMVEQRWGSGVFARLLGLRSQDAIDAYATAERRTGTPSTARAILETMMATDVRELLPLVQVPTLVVHNPEGPLFPVSGGLHLEQHIPGARFLSAEAATLPFQASPDMRRLGDELEAFFVGSPPAAPPPTDRVLATVMFTDIVGSTARAAALGDRRWLELLDDHDRVVRAEITRRGGHEVKSTGDGFLATFPGPAAALRSAEAIIEATRALDLEIRVGIHVGECERRGQDLAGMAVHIAARVGARAEPRQVLATRTVRDLVIGSELRFVPQGSHELKGVDEPWDLVSLELPIAAG